MNTQTQILMNANATKPVTGLGAISQTSLAAWGLILLTSALPEIAIQKITNQIPHWLSVSKIALLALFLAATYFLAPLRKLRSCSFIFLTIFATQQVIGKVMQSSAWNGWISGSFSKWMLGSQLLNCALALIIIAVLFCLGKRRSDFFLTAGREEALAEPVWWLWFRRPTPWSRFGPALALCIGGGLMVFLSFAGKPSLLSLQKLPALLPGVCLFAAMNAFAEEMSYRASFLSTLREAVGDRQALWLTATWFGLAHYFGVPYGITGVVMAGWLGWVLGKAMIETSGVFWPWFIHFVQDMLIFSFLALGAVTPGGSTQQETPTSPSPAIVQVQPQQLAPGKDAVITYEANKGPLTGASKLSLHYGINGWNDVKTIPMTASKQNCWSLTIHIPENAHDISFAFTDGAHWDNNGGQDWHSTK